MPEMEIDQKRLWTSFSEAVGAELREATQIRGISGLDHPVQAVSVDDKGKRVIVISAEADARTAALMQVDIQATFSDARVLVARPLAFDVSTVARQIFAPLGITQLEVLEVKKYLEHIKSRETDDVGALKALQNPIRSITTAFSNGSIIELPLISFIMNAVNQAAAMPWKEILAIFDDSVNSGTIDFKAILSNDTMALDLRSGVCPIPFYQFDKNDIESFNRKNNVEENKQILKKIGVYQYFYPAADHLALGAIDQGINSQSKVLQATESAPTLGHPFGDSEITGSPANLIDTLERLKEIGYVAEGEHGLEVTVDGKTIRNSVKFKPREGLVTKILNRISVNASVSPADFIKH